MLRQRKRLRNPGQQIREEKSRRREEIFYSSLTRREPISHSVIWSGTRLKLC